MSTLLEIENAAEALSPGEQQQLLLFLASRLRASPSSLPPPRQFTREQVAGWVAEDEAGWQRFQSGQ
jgi:hypothetical protein